MCCARLAENLARKIYSESISRHLQQRGSQLRTVLDPFQLFPLELPVSNSVFRWVWEVAALSGIVNSRASNEGSRIFHNHREGPY